MPLGEKKNVFLWKNCYAFYSQKYPNLHLWHFKKMKSFTFRISQYKKNVGFYVNLLPANFIIAVGCGWMYILPLTLLVGVVNTDGSKAVGKSVSTLISKMPIWSRD